MLMRASSWVQRHGQLEKEMLMIRSMTMPNSPMGISWSATAIAMSPDGHSVFGTPQRSPGLRSGIG